VNSKLSNFLIIAAKNAVNAGLLAGMQIFHDPQDNNFHTVKGLEGIAWMIVTAVAVREGSVWVPKIISWSAQTNGGINRER
jgi:hypothetical protein